MASGFGCMVVGPAGSGKSTFCHAIQEAAEQQGRTIKVCNLDPAAEVFKYKCDIDIRDLVSLDDV
jgi:GTPase SAR1 family protein